MSKSQAKPGADDECEHYVIYVMCDPRTTEVRYVGCTRDLKKRIRTLISEARRSGGMDRHPRNKWLFRVLRAGFLPTVHILDETDDVREAAQMEQDWIRRLVEKGADLRNIPGNGVYSPRPRSGGRPALIPHQVGRRLPIEAAR